MKIIIYLISVFFAMFGSGCQSNENNLSIKTTDTDTIYKFSASFGEGKVAQLQAYLSTALNSKVSFDHEGNQNIRLNDKDHFSLKSTAGSISINFDKMINSPAGYTKLKTLAAGIQNKLREDK